MQQNLKIKNIAYKAKGTLLPVLCVCVCLIMPVKTSAYSEDLLGVDVQCSDLLGNINMSIFDLFSFDVGPCTISLESTEIEKCGEKINDVRFQANSLLGNNSFQVGCFSDDITSDYDDRLEKRLEKGLSFLSSSSVLSDKFDGEAIFNGGETTLETKKIIFKEAGELSMMPDYAGDMSRGLGSDQSKFECSMEETAVGAIDCDMKQGLSAAKKKAKDTSKNERVRADGYGANADLATTKKYGIHFPCEKAKQILPVENKRTYEQAASLAMSADSFLNGSLSALQEQQDSLRSLSARSASESGVSTYDDKTIEATNKRQIGAMP